MAEYVNDLPERGDEGGIRAENAADEGLAGEIKQAGLVAENRPERETNAPRPVGVAFAAMLMFAAAAWMMPFIFILEPGLGNVPPAALGAALGIMTLFGVVASMAMFMLKRWSVVVFSAVAIITNLIFLAVGEWSPIHLVVPLIVLAVAYSQIKYLQ